MPLRLATEEEKAARDVLTHAEWGGLLTVEQFLEREQRLRAHPWAARVMATWVLEEDGRLLASCETFRMPSLLKLPDGRRQVGGTYGVASVFVEPPLRGRGHAWRMMASLREVLEAGDAQAQGSLLFSDVGPALYERAGYAARPGVDAVLPAGGEWPAQVQRLTEAMLPVEWPLVRTPDVPFLVWAGPDQVDWHLERERFYAEMLERSRPSAMGARAGESRAFWAVSWKDDALWILWLDARTPDEAGACLRAARAAAAEAGVREVRLWDSSALGPWTSALDGLPLRSRGGCLPMLHGFREGVASAAWHVIPRALWI
jgi:GNAT superfamily N-acetyltransferase